MFHPSRVIAIAFLSLFLSLGGCVSDSNDNDLMSTLDAEVTSADAGPDSGTDSATPDSDTTPSMPDVEVTPPGGCTSPGQGQYVATACSLGEEGGTDTVLAECSAPESGQFVQTACLAGNPDRAGADTVITDCSIPETGSYIASTCQMGTPMNAGVDTIIAACSEPEGNQWVSEVCLPGDLNTVGTDTVTTACTIPRMGYYVTQVCVLGRSTELGADTVDTACSEPSATNFVTTVCVTGATDQLGSDTATEACSAPAQGQHVTEVCRLGDSETLGQNTTLSACTLVGSREFLAAECTSGNIDVVGQDTQVTSCDDLARDEWPADALISVPGDLDVTTLADDYCVGVCEVAVGGDFVIENTMLENLDAFGCITSVARDLRIYGNENLSDVSGLSVSSVGRDLVVEENQALCPTLADEIWREPNTQPGDRTMIFDNQEGCDLDEDGYDADIDCDDRDPQRWSSGMYREELRQEDLGGFCRGFCTRNIQGSVMLESTSLNRLPDLSCIERIEGMLMVTNNSQLVSLDGLDGLRVIDGMVVIRGNQSLRDLSGLEMLQRIDGSVEIEDNQGLLRLEGLNGLQEVGDQLRIGNQHQLGNFRGLESLVRVGSLDIFMNSQLRDLTGLESLTEVSYWLSISENSGLVRLDGLDSLFRIGEGLRLERNDQLRELAGFPQLQSLRRLELRDTSFTAIRDFGAESIEDGIIIENNPMLESVDGFSRLLATRELMIANNPALTAIRGFNVLSDLDNLFLERNPRLAEIAGFDALSSVRSLYMAANDEMVVLDSFTALSRADAIQISEHRALSDLKGFDRLTRIQGQLTVNNNLALKSIAGFKALENAEELNISDNPRLSNLTDGFGALQSIRRMNIYNNEALCELEARRLQRSASTPNDFGFFQNNQGQIDACGTCGGNAAALDECPLETRDDPRLFRAAEVAAYAAACFDDLVFFDENTLGLWVSEADDQAADVASSLDCAQRLAPPGPLLRMARYESSEVGGQAIDMLNRLSFRGGDGAFYAVRSTQASDDPVSTVEKEASAIAKAAAINASTHLHGVIATPTPALSNLGFVGMSPFDETNNLVINGETIIGFSTQINDADGSLVNAINAVSDQTGVVASMVDGTSLMLRAEDGRNIDVIINDDLVGPGIEPAAERVYRGGLILTSRNAIELGGGIGRPAGATQTNLLGGHNAGALLLDINVLSEAPFNLETCPDSDQFLACFQ